MNVKILTVCFGILLTLFGIGYVYVAGMNSYLTFMPTLFGVLIIVLGFSQGRWEHKHSHYGPLMLAMLTFLGSLRALSNLLTGVTTGETTEPTPVIVRSIIGIFSILFIALAGFLIKDFWSGWKAFGHFLGDWLARVVLTIFYFTVFVPFGLGVRIFADPLFIKKQPDQRWQSRTTGDRTLQELRRQF